MGIERGLFNRTELLVGADVMDAITAQQMQQVARELFDEQRLTTLIFK